MTISGKKVTKKEDVAIDPRLFAPPNIVDVVSASIEEEDSDYGYGLEEDDLELEVEDLDNVDLNNDLPVPSSIRVVQQIVRISDNGTMLVDVVLEAGNLSAQHTLDIRISDSSGVRQ